MISLTFSPSATKSAKSAALAVFVAEDLALAAKSELGAAASYVAQAITAAEFKAKRRNAELINPGKTPSHLLVIGLGKASEATELTVQEAGAAAYAAALAAKVTQLRSQHQPAQRREARCGQLRRQPRLRRAPARLPLRQIQNQREARGQTQTPKR